MRLPVKKAKIMCTIGPASGSPGVIRSMVRSGMDAARLNFSHGTYKEHEGYIRAVRKCSASLKRPVAIVQDLQGIKIRIGDVQGGSVSLKTGDRITMRPGNRVSTADTIFVAYAHLTRDVKKGDRVLIDDGLVQLKVVAGGKDGLEVRVLDGGTILPRKGVNLPDSRIRVSSFTAKDRQDLEFGISHNVDYVAVSFVRNSDDILKIKRFIKSRGRSIPVIAKIEKREALEDIGRILNASDGIMIARGDLGVEIRAEEVPIVQKELINRANNEGKIVITATQMLESMTRNKRPTRAEAADVANAVIDGSDAVMLSAETSTGRYPVEAVTMMRKIIEHAERHMEKWEVRHGEDNAIKDYPYAVAGAAVKASHDIGSRVLVAFTDSGYTARLVSRFRPNVPVIALSSERDIIDMMSLYRGVEPFYMPRLKHTDEMIAKVEEFLKAKKYARKGDTIAVIASSPLVVKGKTNFMKLHTVS